MTDKGMFEYDKVSPLHMSDF